MIIKFRLKKLLEQREMTQIQLSNLTKIRPATINAFYNNYAKRVHLKDLAKICKALGCKLSDLIEYIPKNSK